MDALAQRFEPLDTTAEVETPEHIRFAYPLAGPTRRAVAYLIDLVIRIAIVFVLVLLLTLVDVAVGFDGVSVGLSMVIYFAIDWFYYVFFESLWSGRTPGKRALRLRVVGQDGHSLTLLDSVLRNLLRAADFLPFGYAIGLVVMGRDPMFRRLGDMVAGTVVVIEDRGRVTERLQLHPPPTLDELERLPARPPVSRDELEAIELFLRRRGTLAPLREIELAEMAAPTIARRMGYTSVHDPVRFLGLVYARARGYTGAPNPPPPRGGPQHWPQQGYAPGVGQGGGQQHHHPSEQQGLRWSWDNSAPSQQPSWQAPPPTQPSWQEGQQGPQAAQPSPQPSWQGGPSAPVVWGPPASSNPLNQRPDSSGQQAQGLPPYPGAGPQSR